MSRKISDAFASGKAFIPFITCGDPSLEITEQLVYAMEEAGADLIELGIPFSDPTAEGPVIQAANVRALAGGVTTDKIFEMAERIIDGRDYTFDPRKVFKSVYCLIICHRYILSPSRVVKVCMFRPDARVIQSCRYRIHRRDLSVFILAEI